MDVYKASAFEDRVNYAASVISKGVLVMNARHFDTCFEMGDGDYVAAALIRRTEKNPNTKLAANLFRFIGEDSARKAAEKFRSLTRKQLHDEAVRTAVDGAERIGYSNL